MQNKVTKQVEITQHRLSRELDKLKVTEKSEIRMIETTRRRFRMKYRKQEFPNFGSSSAMDVHVHDDHSDATMDNDSTTRKIHEQDSFNALHSMLFTDGEVDPDKLLCLHLLTAHAVTIGDDQNSPEPLSPTTKKELVNSSGEQSENRLNSPWNEVLPCYIVEIQEDESMIRKRLEQEYVAQLDLEDKAIYDLELRCRKYAECNEEFGRTLQSRLQKPSSLGMASLISSNLYKNLNGVACERIHSVAQKTPRSSTESSHSSDNLEKPSNDESSGKLKPSDIKKNLFSKSAILSNIVKQKSIESFQFTDSCVNVFKKKQKHYIYLDSSFASNKIKKENYKKISVSINSQLKLLVQMVLEVLQNVNIEKTKRFLETLQNPKEINTILSQPKIKAFLQSLKESVLFSSPENFILISGLAIEQSNTFFKKKFKNLVIAETLEVGPISEFDDLITEIKKNIHTFLKVENENDAGNLLKKEHGQTSGSIKSTNKKASDQRNDNLSPKSTNKLIEADSDESLKILHLQTSISKESDSKSETSKRKKKKTFAGLSSLISSSSHSSTQSEYKKIMEQSENANSRQDPNCHSDPERVILRRMTNAQRILVGQMCASLKTKKVNTEGLLEEKVPFAAIITPVLSRESIKLLTQGTIYAKDDEFDKLEESKSGSFIVNEKLTDSLLSKIRHEVAEIETQRKLEKFMKNVI